MHKEVKLELTGFEMFEKEVHKSGNSGRVYVPVEWIGKKVKGLLEMPAAINIHTGEIHYWFFDWKNSFVVIECFEDLLHKYPGKDINVIMDCWSAHTSYAIKVWNFFHPRFHIVYTPTKASWMNMIERVFSKFEKDILQNSDFQTVREAMTRITNYFDNESSFRNWGA